MYEKILQQIGLNEKEAIIYETMLETGPIEAREILKKVSSKMATTRSNFYNILATLKQKGLLMERVRKGKNLFEPESPARLIAVIALQLIITTKPRFAAALVVFGAEPVFIDAWSKAESGSTKIQ